MKEGELS